ncbi:MAG: VTT domain-containing protein, partial [Nanoarchaeota archaeon]|nr:VTT domain-containing protein [Nanoarchaeota archaeon]
MTNEPKKENHSIVHKKAIDVSKGEILKNILWIIVILAILYTSIRFVGTDNLNEKVEAAGIFGPLILIFLKASTLVFAPLGGLPLYLAAGALFGVFKGVSYILIGDFIGFTASFHISRIFGRKVVTHFMSKHGMKAVNDVITHMGTTKGLVQSCFVFIGFPEAVSYGAGLTKVNYLKFISIIMTIWIIPAS